MRHGLRSLLGRLRAAALAPVTARIEALEAATSTRLDELAKRVGDMDALLQAVEGRAATVAERSVAQQESQARLARRLDEIERLLSER